MPISTGYESMNDVHDGISAINVVLSNPAVVIPGVASTAVFPTGTSLDPADGMINVTGANTIAYSRHTQARTTSVPSTPAINTYAWNYSTNGAIIIPNTTNGSYDVDQITSDNATITFHIIVNDGGNVQTFEATANIAVAREGTSGSAAENALSLRVSGDRGAFVVDRDNDGRLSFVSGINGNISLSAVQQNLGPNDVTWSRKLAGETNFTDIRDDNGSGAVLDNVGRGDVMGDTLVLRAANFAFLPSGSATQTAHQLITYQASKVGPDGNTYVDTWDVLLDTNAADGIDGEDGSDAFLTDVQLVAGATSFKNSMGSGTFKAVLIRGGTVTPDRLASGSYINTYEWSYTVGGVTTVLVNSAVERITGTTDNGSNGGVSGNFNYHTLVVEADGTALGGNDAGGAVTWSCAINYEFNPVT